MDFANFTIIIFSLIPAIGLAVCIFFLDRLEREPVRLLLILAVLGGLVYLPAHFLSNHLAELMEAMKSSAADRLLYRFCVALIGVALVQELAKWIVMRFVTWNAPDFDCFFDGIVYGAFTGLGFAVCGSGLYFRQHGADTLLRFTLLHLPVQLMLGIVMGLFYSMAREAQASAKERTARGRLGAALFLPVVLHGIYAWIRLEDSSFGSLTAILFMLCLAVICFVIVAASFAGDHFFGDIRDQSRIVRDEKPGVKKKRVINTAAMNALKGSIRALYFVVSVIILMISTPILNLPDSKFDRWMQSFTQGVIDHIADKRQEELSTQEESEEGEDVNSIVDPNLDLAQNSDDADLTDGSSDSSSDGAHDGIPQSALSLLSDLQQEEILDTLAEGLQKGQNLEQLLKGLNVSEDAKDLLGTLNEKGTLSDVLKNFSSVTLHEP